MVCFIGHDLVDKFFPNVDPLGKEILINDLPFQVIGVAEAIGNTFGQSQDNFVIMPLTTYTKFFVPHPSDVDINVQAADSQQMLALEDEARALLRARRHVPYQEDDNFGVNASQTIMALWDRIMGTVFMVTIGVVAVFMVVGGIVIMNIMLAAVTERTQEIGIRKSLGARRRDILNQFLVEAATLSATGGLLGVLIAWVLAVLIRQITPVPMALPWSSVVIGVGLSALVGLFFGIYPARQASKLDPIEALRVER
jgi:putative ABC transport system permease protein